MMLLLLKICLAALFAIPIGMLAEKISHDWRARRGKHHVIPHDTPSDC